MTPARHLNQLLWCPPCLHDGVLCACSPIRGARSRTYFAVPAIQDVAQLHHDRVPACSRQAVGRRFLLMT